MQVSNRTPKNLKILCLTLCLLVGHKSLGKDLTGRWGFGATHLELSGNLTPAFAARYHLSESNHTEGFFGIDSDDSKDFMLWGIRYNRNLFLEDNMNFSLGLAGGLLSELKADATPGSGYLIEAALSGEFFLPGLPNLGFNLSTAFRFESPRGARMRTCFLSGFFYYF